MALNQNKPYKTNEHNVVIPDNRQSITITVGSRNSGKSACQELFLESLFEKGWTVFDAWCAGMESMFYCVCLGCRKKREDKISKLKQELEKAHEIRDAEKSDEIIKQISEKRTELGCICHKRYPITILCHETVNVDQKSLDKINGVFYSKEEWYEKRGHGVGLPEFDPENPPMKPPSYRPIELIKVVKLPHPTKKNGTKTNKEIERIFTDTLVSCRTERRILCYVPALFPDDFARYKTIGVIITALPEVMANNFKPFSEDELGIPKSSFTKYQKNHHRMCLLLRELGSIAPNNMKGNEFAHFTKRGVLSIIRESRHIGVTILADCQRIEDVFTSIRAQSSTIILKNTSNSLLGDELLFVKKWIEKMHEKTFSKFGYNDQVKEYVHTKYPPLNQLDKNYCYVVFSDDFISLTEIPNTNHHKKQEDDNLEKLIGFSYTVDEELLESLQNKKTEKSEGVSEDEKKLFRLIYRLRNPKEGKGESWKIIKQELVEKQNGGEFKKSNKFKDMDHESIARWFKRNFEKFKESV